MTYETGTGRLIEGRFPIDDGVAVQAGWRHVVDGGREILYETFCGKIVARYDPQSNMTMDFNGRIISTCGDIGAAEVIQAFRRGE